VSQKELPSLQVPKIITENYKQTDEDTKSKMNKDSAEDIDSSRSRSVDFNLQTKTFDGKPRPDANGFTFY
jgi:hypothetical protein